MRVFISVDMEGISGLEKIEECFLGMPAYDKGRQIMAGDVNAARSTPQYWTRLGAAT